MFRTALYGFMGTRGLQPRGVTVYFRTDLVGTLYTPRMLRTLDIEAAPVAKPLLEAVDVLRNDAYGAADRLPAAGIRSGAGCCAPNPTTACGRRRCCSTCATSSALATSGWRGRAATATSGRRCCRPPPSLMPTRACRSPPVRMIGSPSASSRSARVCAGWTRAARAGTIAGASIDDGMLRIERTEAAVPDGAGDLVADLYQRIPDTRITDILLEVDDATRFTEAFTHLRTGAPCRDRIGLLNVLLAEGINLGLRKMAEATTTHGFWELMRIARWHVEGEAYDRALSVVGTEPGLKAYSHVSDRFSPFATQTIPATVHEAPYILDGQLPTVYGAWMQKFMVKLGGMLL